VTGFSRIALSAGYVVVTFFSFPQPLGGRVLDAGLVLSWLSPALLILAVDGLAPRRALRVGFVASLAAHTAVLHWIYVVTVTYGHAPPVVGVLAPALLAMYVASFGAAFAVGVCWLRTRGVASPFAAAFLWTTLDWLRSFVLTGFPWATLGYAQHANGALLGLASFTGVYGLSFVVALGGATLAGVARRRIPTSAAVVAGSVVALAHLVGWLAPDPDAEARATLRVGVLQGNIDQGVKWSPDHVESTLVIYEDLTRRATREGARLVVWPETAVPGSIERDGRLRSRLARLARETGATLLVGGVGIDAAPGEPASYHDSAYVFDSGGRLLDRYDKTHLVPFGEYVPLRGLIGRFVGAVASGIAVADVTAGDEPRGVEVAGVRAGVPICFELLFPDLVRRFAADGGGILLAITNDAWYGRTGAPHQFLAITALRSAETRLWTARAANTGVSAFIDARGRVREQTPVFEAAHRVMDVPIHADPAHASFYVRHGDVFAWACALAALAWPLWARGRGRAG
jgi:apolipoprotein N-acyltransferase